MKGKIALGLLVICLTLGFPPRIFAQTGTPHGITTKFNAPSPVGGSGTLQGFYLFRCVGTASTCTLTAGTWTAVGGLLPPNVFSGVNCTGYTNCYLDPAAGLAVNTSYVYAVAAVDSNGSQSSWDLAAAPAVVGASFPTNPNAPSGCNSTVN